MTWSLHLGAVALNEPARSIPKAAERTLAELRARGPAYASQYDAEETRAEVAEQIEAAVKAATALTNGLGEGVKAVIVNLYGHANPAHQPREGWAPESVTVSVTTVEG